MEPVKIDFLIGGNAEQEGDKVVQTMDKITGSVNRAKNELKQAIKEKKMYISEIESQIASLEKMLPSAASKPKQSIEKNIGELKQALQSAGAELDALESQVDKTADKHTRLRTQVMEAKDALAQMEMAGKRGTEEYNAMAQRLGQLNDQMGDTAMQARILADDEAGYKAVASGVSGIAGAMSAAVGAVSLFGAGQEELAKIQTRLQSVMAITIGLQQVAETLNKDSYFSVKLLTGAKNLYSAAVFNAGRKLIGFGMSATAARIAAQALMATLTLGLPVAIGLLISLYQKLAKQQETANKLQKEYNDAQKDGYKAAASQVEAIQSLERVASNLNEPMKKRLDALNKLNAVMPEYNGHLDKETGKLTANKNALMDYITALANMEVAKKLAMNNAERTLKMVESEQNEADVKSGRKPAPVKYVPKVKIIGASSTGYVQSAEPTKSATESALKSNVDAYSKEQQDYRAGLQKENDKTNALIQKLNAKTPTLLSDVKTGGGGGKSATAKPTKEAYDAETELQEKLISLREQTTKLHIDAMQDGLEKRLAEIDAEKQQEIDKITKAQQDIVDAYNKNHHGEKGFTKAEKIEDVKGIKPETLKAWNDEAEKVNKAAEDKRVKAAADANMEIIRLANSYADERMQIAERYGQDIEKLEKAGQTGAATRAKAERDKRVSDTTAEMIMSTELYKTATDEKLQISAEATAKLIEDITKRIEAEMAAGNLGKEKGKEMLDELNKTGISRQQNARANNPFARLMDGLNAYKKAKADLETKRGQVSPEEFAELEAAANSALKSTAAAAGASLDGVNAILGSVVGALDQLGLLTDEQKKDAQDVMDMVGGAASIAKGIATGNPIDIITGAVNLLASAISFFDFKSKKIAKQQKELKANLDDLGRAYQNLQREISKALGTDVFAKQRSGIENLKKQTQDYYKLIALEQQKKKKKQDQNAIAEWKDKIESNKAEMEAILADIRTQMVGGAETKSVASDLANALVSAFQQGEDSAQAFGKVFDDVIRNAVLNAFKLRYLEKPIDEWLNKLGNYMEDGELQDWEKRALDAEKKAIYEQAQSRFTAISGFFSTDDAKGKGIQGEVKNISEETGGKLIGAVNAMRLNVDEIVKNNRSGIDIMSRQLAALEEIKQNTSFCKKLERMDETLYDLKVNGIKMR